MIDLEQLFHKIPPKEISGYKHPFLRQNSFQLPDDAEGTQLEIY